MSWVPVSQGQSTLESYLSLVASSHQSSTWGQDTGSVDMHSCFEFGVWLPSPFHSFMHLW